MDCVASIRGACLRPRVARRRLPRLIAFVALATRALMGPAATAQEPAVLTGAWAGTWWMGKYEEPVELELTQTRGGLTGRVSVWNYPGAGASDGRMPVRASVTGTVDGRRVRLSWAMPQHGAFTVELTLLTPDQLFGAGGPGVTTAGFDLRRSP
jgi:hypothetical protein